MYYTNTKFEKELHNRLVRIESKLVRGFEELGVNIDKEQDWLTVEDQDRTVFISTLGRSLSVLLNDMVRMGATQFGKVYSVVHKGELIGSVVLQKVV